MKILITFFLWSLIQSCGQPSPSIKPHGYDESETPEHLPTPFVEETTQNHDLQFNLIEEAGHMVAHIDGCASGYTKTFSYDNPVFQLYKFDRGCTAQLVEFTLDQNVYTLAQDTFSTKVGDINIFQSPQGHKVYAQVTEQLPDTITAPMHNFAVILQDIQSSDSIELQDTDVLTLITDRETYQESDNHIQVTIKRVLASQKKLKINLVYSGKAKNKKDFKKPNNPIVIKAGENQKIVLIPILNDTVKENNEKLTIKLKPSKHYLSYQGQKSIIIEDDDIKIPKGIALFQTHKLDVGPLQTWKDHYKKHDATSQIAPFVEETASSKAILFSGDDHYSIPDHKRLNLRTLKQRSYWVALTTGEDIQSRQLIYKQGNKKNGQGLWIENGFFVFHSWGNKQKTELTDSGSYDIQVPIGPGKDYVFYATYHYDASQITLETHEKTKVILNGTPKIKKHAGGIEIGGLKTELKLTNGELSQDDNMTFLGNMKELRIDNKIFSQNVIDALWEDFKGRHIAQ